MSRGVKGRIAVFLLCGLSVLGSGCGAEELAAQVPETAYLELEGESLVRVASGERGRLEQRDAAAPKDSGGAGGWNFLSQEASGHFAYASLSQDRLAEEEKLWYRDMEECLGTMSGEIRLSSEGIDAGMDETYVDRIFQCVMCDHPELFYVDGYSYSKYTRGDSVVAISFSGTYSMDKREAVYRRRQIDASVASLLSETEEGMSQYELVKFVYETLIRRTEYDLEAPDNQNVYSVFVNGASVCLGYAKATQYLLNCLGVECALVQGKVGNGEGHAWNLVKVDGSYYYVDTTWGDASYRRTEGVSEEDTYQPSINYDYLCVTTGQLLRTHTIDGPVPMPECTDLGANYYVREGAYFTAYDGERLKRLFARAEELGREDVTVKCSDEECFRQMRERLIDGQEIFAYMPEGESVAFASNDRQLSLTFWKD